MYIDIQQLFKSFESTLSHRSCLYCWIYLWLHSLTRTQKTSTQAVTNCTSFTVTVWKNLFQRRFYIKYVQYKSIYRTSIFFSFIFKMFPQFVVPLQQNPMGHCVVVTTFLVTIKQFTTVVFHCRLLICWTICTRCLMPSSAIMMLTR